MNKRSDGSDMTKQSDGSDTSLQSNMKAEADGQMRRQDPIADTAVQSLCVCVCLMVMIHPLERPNRCHEVLCDAQ
jgi:hypothetical protein